MSIADNLKTVMDRIASAARRAGRDPSSVKLVVVTKTVDPVLGNIASWHLIGRLQTNKAKYAVKLFDLIHSVDSVELAKELDRQAVKINKVQPVLIEVSIAGEESKAGVRIDETMDLIKEAAKLKNIAIQGLMTMPPFLDNPEDSRPYFRKLRELAQSAAREDLPGVSMKELSMGMSGDFEVAIEEGATMVRVGTAIFGERT
jgi:PLP dependent protein